MEDAPQILQTTSPAIATRTSPSGNFLDFAGVVIISTIMLIVLNILAAARRSGHLAADGIAAG